MKFVRALPPVNQTPMSPRGRRCHRRQNDRSGSTSTRRKMAARLPMPSLIGIVEERMVRARKKLLTHYSLSRYSPGTSSSGTSCVRTSFSSAFPASSTPVTTSASNAFPSSNRATRRHSPNPHLRRWTVPANLPIASPNAFPVPPGRMPPYPRSGFSPEPVS